MLLVFVILGTFYGANRAYIAISWFPITFFILIWLFRQVLAFEHVSDEWWRDLAVTLGWASLVQAGLGIGLLVRSFHNRNGTIILFLATSLSLSPFFLRGLW